MLNRQQKEEQVSALREKLSTANTLVAIDYRGLSVGDANDLRGRLRQAESEIDYRVAKNTIIRRAIDGTDAAGLVDHLTGPTALAIGYDEPSVVARALFDYAKENESFEIKGGVVDGEVVGSEVLERLAKLPTKQELRGMLAGTLQAPLRNLAGTLNALLSQLRNALEQRQGQLEA